MLDKIMLSSDRKQATMIFTDRQPFTISSDTDVVVILAWFFDDPRAHVVLNGETVTGLELRKFDDEVTQNILLKDVA